MQECVYLPDNSVLGVSNQRVILEPWVVGLGGGGFVLKPLQEACNLKMNLLARAITQPRESWFDFSIFEDCGRGLRGTLGHLFVTRIDLLCLLGKIRILAAASRFSPCPVNLWGLQKIYLIVLGLIVELQRLCIVDVV